MTNVMRKISAALLSLALVVTMMPFLAMPVNAADEYTGFGVTVNGVQVGSITKAELEEMTQLTQIFPWVAQKGGQNGYRIAQGPAFEDVLKKTAGIDSLSDLQGATIVPGGEDGSTVVLPVNHLINAVSQFKLIGTETDGNESQVFGPFNKSTKYLKIRPENVSGELDIVPIIALHSSEVYTKTETNTDNGLGDAKTDMETDGWATDNSVMPMLGGNLTVTGSDLSVWVDGKANTSSLNFTGRFAIKNPAILAIKVEKKDAAPIVFSKPDAQKAVLPFELPEKTLDLMSENAVWTSSDEKIVTVDKGMVSPVAEGTCTVYAKAKADDADADAVASFEVTVEKSGVPQSDVTPAPDSEVKKPAKPAKPASLKVTNIKKKTAKITWKKSKNAKGYVVYRATKKNGKYKKIATVKKNVYKNKKLKKGKTYFYKVKAYNSANGKKVYSAFSAVKKVKIKK